MTKIVIDDALKGRLNELSEQAAFCDESGRVLGYFVPAEDTFVPRSSDHCPYTSEELNQFRKESGGQPLHEVWRSLGQA